MTAIKSAIDTTSPEFRANQAAMGALVTELQTRRAAAAEGGPPRSRERHLARGKLLPRDRVMTLIDPGSPFLELSPLAADGMYEEPSTPPASSPASAASRAANASSSATTRRSRAAPTTR